MSFLRVQEAYILTILRNIYFLFIISHNRRRYFFKLWANLAESRIYLWAWNWSICHCKSCNLSYLYFFEWLRYEVLIVTQKGRSYFDKKGKELMSQQQRPGKRNPAEYWGESLTICVWNLSSLLPLIGLNSNWTKKRSSFSLKANAFFLQTSENALLIRHSVCGVYR